MITDYGISATMVVKGVVVISVSWRPENDESKLVDSIQRMYFRASNTSKKELKGITNEDEYCT